MAVTGAQNRDPRVDRSSETDRSITRDASRADLDTAVDETQQSAKRSSRVAELDDGEGVSRFIEFSRGQMKGLRRTSGLDSERSCR